MNELKMKPHSISSLSMPIRFYLGDLQQRGILAVPPGTRVRPIQNPFVMNQDVEESTDGNTPLNIVNGVFRSVSGRVSGMIMELEEGKGTRSIVVVFCGSQSVYDTMTSSQIWMKKDPTGGPGMIHAGFAEAYDEIRSMFLGQMRLLFLKNNGDGGGGGGGGGGSGGGGGRAIVKNVYIGGHSLGGVFAVLAAKDMTSSLHMELDDMRVITFGAPRIGNALFAKDCQNKIGGRGQSSVYRFTHGDDVVPSIPPEWLGYVHFGQEIHLDKDGLWYRTAPRSSAAATAATAAAATAAATAAAERDVILVGQVVEGREQEVPRAVAVSQEVVVVGVVAEEELLVLPSVVAGKRVDTRLESLVDMCRSKPIGDHRVAAYMHHLNMCVAHVEMDEKRLNQMYRDMREATREEETREEETREDAEDAVEGTTSKRVLAMWRVELEREAELAAATSLNDVIVTVDALREEVRMNMERYMKGEESTTSGRFGRVLVAGWKVWHDGSRERRFVSRRLVSKGHAFLKGEKEVVTLEKATVLFQLMEEGRREEMTKCTEVEREETKVIMESRSEIEKKERMVRMLLHRLGCLEPEEGVGRHEILLLELSRHG